MVLVLEESKEVYHEEYLEENFREFLKFIRDNIKKLLKKSFYEFHQELPEKFLRKETDGRNLVGVGVG